MARKKATATIASVLLFLYLLMGAGVSGVWAGDDPGFQLVLVLDYSHPPGDNQEQHLLPQAASLLVHLLGDQNFLTLVGSGKTDGVILPASKLDPEHRNQALDKLAHFTPAPDQQSFDKVMEQALGAFQPEGLKRRVLFWLAGGAGDLDSQQNVVLKPDIEKIVAQARSAGVTIFAARMAPTAQETVWQTLTLATGGRLWEVKTASDLHVPCLKLYQNLNPPKETLINGSQVLLDRWVKQAIFVMTRSSPGKEVELISPQRVRITSKTRAKNIRWVAGNSYDLITLSHPRPGVWSLSGARPDVGNVFLSTDLILSADGTAREVGEDEALCVTAALSNNKGTLTDPNLLARTQFRAEIQLKNTFLTTPLNTPSPGDSPISLPGARLGQFPPLHQEGEGTLKLIALGETFQRLRSLPITIAKPWFQVTPQTSKAQTMLSWRFKPDPDRRPERVGGTVTLKSAEGGMGGVFINPAPGAEIILAPSPGCNDLCLADLHLTGIAPGGRLLDIASGPLPLEHPERVKETSAKPVDKTSAEDKVQRTNPPSLPKKLKRRWGWLALSGLGIAVFLASAVFLWRLRRETDDSEGVEGFTSQKNILRLKAQVEALAKEKARLEEALKEKNENFELLLEEKAELQADLERIQKKYQDNLRAFEDLEKNLEKAEQEAQGVNQEYMALYARNPQEKSLLKKT